MSKKGRRPRNDTPDPPEPPGGPIEEGREPGENDVWIRTEPGPLGSGSYVVTLALGMDHAQVLTPDNSLLYAYYILDALAQAEYDCAILNELMSVGVNEQAAAQVIGAMREKRPPPEDQWLLTARPFVGMMQRKPAVAIGLNPKFAGGRKDTLGTWEPEAARSHVDTVMTATRVAYLDADYLDVLQQFVGLEENVARNMVNDLADFR